MAEKPDLKLIPGIEADPFDPNTFRLSHDDRVEIAEQALTTVACRKPGKTEFFRVHPSDDYIADTALLEHDRDFFMVAPAMRAELRQEIKNVQLFVCMSRTHSVFIWPIRLPGEDGKDNGWWISARAIAQTARQEWVRCTSDRAGAGYVMTTLKVELSDPKWPDKPLRDLCELAFKTQLIDSRDHPIVKLLQGRI